MDDLNRGSSKYHEAEKIVKRAKRIAILIVSEIKIDNIYLCNIERMNTTGFVKTSHSF
jgi:hypothetical protein